MSHFRANPEEVKRQCELSISFIKDERKRRKKKKVSKLCNFLNSSSLLCVFRRIVGLQEKRYVAEELMADGDKLKEAINLRTSDPYGFGIDDVYHAIGTGSSAEAICDRLIRACEVAEKVHVDVDDWSKVKAWQYQQETAPDAVKGIEPEPIPET